MQQQQPAPSPASAAAAVTQSAGQPAASASARVEEEAQLDALPSGAFLTEAPLAVQPLTETSEADDHRDTQADDDDEEDEWAALQLKRAHEAQRKAEAEADEKQNDKADATIAAPLADSSDQSLVVHAPPAAVRSVARRSRPPPAAGSSRAHLFAYTSLFGQSRAAIAAARSARLQSIESGDDAAMAERRLESAHRRLLSALTAEDRARERSEAEALRALARQTDRLREAQRRRAAHEQAQLDSVTLRDRDAQAAERRAAQRKHDAALAAKHARRLAEIRTRALIDSHNDISARWAADEAQAIQRFDADRESRLKQAKMQRTADAGAVSQWRTKVAALGLKDPMVVQQALGYAHPHPHPPASSAHPKAAAAGEEKTAAESGARSTGRTRLPPVQSARASEDSPRRSASASASSASPPRRGYRSPRHGKGRPRHANPINDYHGDNGRTRPDDEPITDTDDEEEQQQREEAEQARRTARDGSSAAARRAATPGGSVAVPSRSSAARGSARSPSSRYDLLPRKHSTHAETAADQHTNPTDAEEGESADPARSCPLKAPTHPPPQLSFWCTAVECAAAALDPSSSAPSSAAAAAAQSAAPPQSAQRAQEEQRLMELLAQQFKDMFTLPRPSEDEAETESAEPVAAAAPAPLSYSLIVGGPAASSQVRVA